MTPVFAELKRPRSSMQAVLCLCSSTPWRASRRGTPEPASMAEIRLRPGGVVMSYQGQAVFEARVAVPDSGRSFPIGATLGCRAAQTSQSSRGVRRKSTCCFSTGWTTPVLRASSRSILVGTARTTIGTCSCPAWKQVRSMDSGPTGRSSRIGVSGSIHPSCSWTRMDARSPSRKTIAVKPRVCRATTPRRP